MAKIIFLDVDGTLVDYENRIPESAVKAIREARKNGHKVYVCTGRSRAEMQAEIWDIGIDGMIGGNGSYVEDDGKVIMHQRITYDECDKIVDYLHQQGLEFYLECNSGLFASENFREVAEPVMLKYMKRKGRSLESGKKAVDAFVGMVFDGDLHRDDVNKISYILNDYEDYENTKAKFSNFEHGTWGGKGEEALFGDIGVKDINKAVSIETLLNHLGASKDDTFAFGDAKVDIPMLKYCDIGVSMGNGGEEIKAMADYITADVEEDGIYKAFKHFELV